MWGSAERTFAIHNGRGRIYRLCNAFYGYDITLEIGFMVCPENILVAAFNFSHSSFHSLSPNLYPGVERVRKADEGSFLSCYLSSTCKIRDNVSRPAR